MQTVNRRSATIALISLASLSFSCNKRETQVGSAPSHDEPARSEYIRKDLVENSLAAAEGSVRELRTELDEAKKQYAATLDKYKIKVQESEAIIKEQTRVQLKEIKRQTCRINGRGYGIIHLIKEATLSAGEEVDFTSLHPNAAHTIIILSENKGLFDIVIGNNPFPSEMGPIWIGVNANAKKIQKTFDKYLAGQRPAIGLQHESIFPQGSVDFQSRLRCTSSPDGKVQLLICEIEPYDGEPVPIPPQLAKIENAKNHFYDDIRPTHYEHSR